MSVEKSSTSGDRLVWVLQDERPGTGNQALGVAEALGGPYVVKDLRYGPLGRMPNIILGSSLRALNSDTRGGITPPWPDVLISAGRRAASVARYIKMASGGHCFVCHLMYPGIYQAASLDLVVVPAHDQVTGSNVIAVTGAPHRVTEMRLEDAREIWRVAWRDIPRPLLGVLLGGGGRRMLFEVKDAERLADEVADWQSLNGGSVLITTSRRSGTIGLSLLECLRMRGIEPAVYHAWNSPEDNPYMGILAAAEVLIVTGDSVSMLSEACAAPGSVFIYRSPGFASRKHLRFHESLLERGAAHLMTKLASRQPTQSINPAGDIARIMMEKLDWL